MFSKVLKSLRIQRNKTQQEIADVLGISRQGYAKYENNLGEPDNSTLSKLADYFEVSTDYLLGRTNTPEPTTKPQQDDEAEFQAFINNPDLGVWYKELPKSSEDELRKLRTIWEMIKSEQKK